MVSAWPEPPSDIPAEWSAEATAAASSERKRLTELASDPSQSDASGRCGHDPPPLKWSDLRYVFDIQEDCNGKEAIQA